jgi:4-hydroxy-2-oxoheptanedioate aldolase
MAMLRNTAKDKLKAGQAVFGPLLSLNSPHLVEICGRVGFDFVYIDCEHGAITHETCEGLVRAAEVVGVPTIVRVPANMPHVILNYLDVGAMGVQVPHVCTKEDAVAAVQAAKYYPLGQRSIGGRWNDYGLGMRLPDYIHFANEQTWLSVMIEDVKALPNLADIMAVEGVDIIHIGPADLASSMGLPAQTSHPEVRRVIETIIKQVAAAGKVAGLTARNAEEAKQTMALGARYIPVNFTGLIAAAGRDFLRAARG